jgi:hypothetical protein
MTVELRQIVNSGNVNYVSKADANVGIYMINFITPMPHTGYCVQPAAMNATNGEGGWNSIWWNGNRATALGTGACGVAGFSYTGGYQEQIAMHVAVFC